MKGLRSYYEQHHGVEISDSAIEAAVQMSVRYINDRFLPDKAIDLIDEACSKVRLEGYQFPENVTETEREIQKLRQEKEAAVKNADLEEAKRIGKLQTEKEMILEEEKKKFARSQKRKKRTVDENAVADIVSGWTKIPVKKLAETESRRLSRLEKNFINESSARMRQLPQWLRQ